MLTAIESKYFESGVITPQDYFPLLFPVLVFLTDFLTPTLSLRPFLMKLRRTVDGPTDIADVTSAKDTLSTMTRETKLSTNSSLIHLVGAKCYFVSVKQCYSWK